METRGIQQLLGSAADKDSLLINAIAAEHAGVKALNLANNALQNITGIQALTSVVRLDLSHNNLQLLDPLSGLISLEELSLTDNNISILDPLRTLTNLRVLNLSSNKVYNLQQLSVISSLVRLHSLSLANNPIESTPGYPDCVFELQPSLMYIDGLERFRKAVMPHTVDSLHDTLGLSSSILQIGMAENGVENSCLPANFPTEKLLCLWRKQALTNASQQELMLQRERWQAAESKRERERMLEKLRCEEAKSLSWRMQASSWEERYNAMKASAEAKDKALAASEHHVARIERKLANYDKSKAFLSVAKSEADRLSVAQSAAILEMMDRLSAQESRLKNATQRIGFAADLVALREVEVRNTMAAMNADRIMWTNQFSSQSKYEERTINSESHGMDVPNAFQTPHDTKGDFKLTAEAEALLLAIFRSMDPHDQGTIEVKQLRSALFTPVESAVDDRVTECALSSVAPLGVIIRRALGDRMWCNLSSWLLSERSQGDLSWGELLLKLLPNPDQPTLTSDNLLCQTSLSVGEMAELRCAGLLGDLDWGVVPLQLPNHYHSSGHTQIGRRNSSSSEVEQLRQERSFLMSRLQHMTRTLERRAESIRSYFQDSLRREQTQSARSAEKIEHLQEHLSSVLHRCEENEQSLVANKEMYQNRLKQLELEIDTLRHDRAENESAILQNCQKKLADQTAKATDLESQLTALRNTSAKKDVKVRALERSMSELRNTHATDTEIIAQLEVKLDKAMTLLTNAQQDYHAATQELRRACDEEKEVLNESLISHKAAVADLQERLLASEGALASAKADLARYSQQEEQLNLQSKMFELLTKDLRTQVAAKQQLPPSAAMDTENTDLHHQGGQSVEFHPPPRGLPPGSSRDIILTRLESLLRNAEVPMS